LPEIASAIDRRCRELTARDPQKLDSIQKLVSKEQLAEWTELLRGLEPIHTDRETVKDWITKYDSKVNGLLELNKTVQEIAEKTNASRILVICCIRELQRLNGLRINYNTYKDSALKMLTTLTGGQTIITPPSQVKPYDESWIPPILLDLEPLSRREQPRIDSEGLNLQAIFEDRLCGALRFLGYEVEQLGHKSSKREPDGIAMSRRDRYAILFDAKTSSEGYRVGTDDREIMEYIDSHKDYLEEQGISRIYFLIVSSQFKGDFDQQIRKIAREKNVLLALMKAEDLLYLLEWRIRDPRLVNPKTLHDLFNEMGLLTKQTIEELLSIPSPSA